MTHSLCGKGARGARFPCVRATRRRGCALLLAACAAVAACDGASGSARQPAPVEPPIARFVAPATWHPTWGKGPAVEPPDLDGETWRVFVNQFEPIQRETPAWQALPARAAVELKMPPGSRHRCVVSPLEVVAQPDDFGAKLEHWLLVRTMVCSSDGFASWSSYPHRVALGTDGSRRVITHTDALLHEHEKDGSARESAVTLRSDKEVREASLGAPRILEGVEVAD